MSYFHSPTPISKKGRLLFSVLGETLEEMLSVARRWPEETLINLPPRGRDSFRSRSLPQLYVDHGRPDILEELGSVEVPLDYIPVLRMMLREQIYNERLGSCDDSRRFFELEIRGKVIQLLRSGSWVDEPENLSLKKLNNRIEKCDLGRRSDLKFSSTQSEKQKYDQDLRKDRQKPRPEETLLDWHEMDTDHLIELMKTSAADGLIADIWNEKPWLHGKFQEAGLKRP